MPHNNGKAAKRKYQKKEKTGLNNKEKSEVKDIISNRKEDKYCPAWYHYDSYATTGGFLQDPLSTPITLPGVYDNAEDAANVLVLQTGAYLNSASTQVNSMTVGAPAFPMGGYGMERGDTSTTIDGNYAYMQSSKIMLNITASVMESNQGSVYDPAFSALRFRVIQVRAKKDQSGVTPSLVSELFLDTANAKTGLSFSGSTKELMQDYRINRSQFIVDKDFQFRLNQPCKPSVNIPLATDATGLIATAVGGAASRPAHPANKQLDLWLENPKKRLRFSQTDDSTFNYFEPINYDFVTYVVILCCRDSPAQSNTSLQSVARAWSCRATGMTKYRDC